MIKCIIQAFDGIGYLKKSSKMKPILLSTAYLPNIAYLSQILNHEQIFIEQHEYFVKQTFRNRCEIVTANGKLSLSIPLIKQADKEIISEKKISYAEDWQKQHWRAMTSAYKNSPYFEFFEDDFKPFYETQFEYLLDYNTQILHTILHVLRVKKQINFTTQFELNPNEIVDSRNFSDKAKISFNEVKPYYQVFSDRIGFTPNLSCLDALFNIGLETKLLEV